MLKKSKKEKETATENRWKRSLAAQGSTRPFPPRRARGLAAMGNVCGGGRLLPGTAPLATAPAGLCEARQATRACEEKDAQECVQGNLGGRDLVQGGDPPRWGTADLRWALGTVGQVSPSRAVSQLKNKQAAARSRLPLVPRLQEVEAGRRHGNRQLTASWEGQPPASAFPGPLHRPGAQQVIFHRRGGKGEENKGPAFPQAAPGTASPQDSAQGGLDPHHCRGEGTAETPRPSLHFRKGCGEQRSTQPGSGGTFIYSAFTPTPRHGGDPPSDYSVPRGFSQSKTWEVLRDNTPVGRARRGSRGQAGAAPEPAGTAASRQQLG